MLDFLKKESQPPASPIDPHKIQDLRREGLEQAKESGALTMSASQSQQLTEQARAQAVNTITSADHLLEAPHAPDAAQHAAHIAVEQAQAGEQVIPVNIDHSGNLH